MIRLVNLINVLLVFGIFKDILKIFSNTSLKLLKIGIESIGILLNLQNILRNVNTFIKLFQHKEITLYSNKRLETTRSHGNEL